MALFRMGKAVQVTAPPSASRAAKPSIEVGRSARRGVSGAAARARRAALLERCAALVDLGGYGGAPPWKRSEADPVSNARRPTFEPVAGRGPTLAPKVPGAS